MPWSHKNTRQTRLNSMLLQSTTFFESVQLPANRSWTEKYANWKANEEKIKRLAEMGFTEKKVQVIN